jgi:hypothetical protein
MPPETRSKTAFILGCRDKHVEGPMGPHLKRHGPERGAGISPLAKLGTSLTRAAGLHGFERLLIHAFAVEHGRKGYTKVAAPNTIRVGSETEIK